MSKRSPGQKRGRAARRSAYLAQTAADATGQAEPRIVGPPNSPAELREGEWPIDTGTVGLKRDHHAPNAWTVLVNGVPSSHIDLDDPRALNFEYMRWMAYILDGHFGSNEGLRALHLGGGAASLPRWVQGRFPDSRQVVVELDAKLNELVRAWFGLPRAPHLRLRAGDALEVVPTLSVASRDVVVRDVFAGDATPPGFSERGFVAEVARILSPGGLYMVNVGDRRDLANTRLDHHSLNSIFANVIAVSDPAMFKGRRRGNVVLVASDAPLSNDAQLRRRLLSDPIPAQVMTGSQLNTRFTPRR